MSSEMEMARGYDIYSSAARRVRDTHYMPDLELNQHCQGGQDLIATHENIRRRLPQEMIYLQMNF